MAAHYVKPAGRTHTPGAVIFVDTETRWKYLDGLEVHELRCWEAQIVRRRDRRRPGEHLTESGTDPAILAKVVDSWACRAESTWLYTHNVSFDLTVTRLASLLAELGWELSPRHAIGGANMWAVFRKGPRQKTTTDVRDGRKVTRTRTDYLHTLTIADSASLFPCALAELQAHVGIVKPALPGNDDSEEAWAARCHADTGILRAAVLQLMDWWDAADLGQWTVTGAGQAWQTYKRTLDPKSVVIDHDDSVIAWERAAVYGGRRDLMRIGDLPPGRYAEVDLEAAYTTVAAYLPLPAKLACRVNDQHRHLALKGRVPMGMLAEVTINAHAARWPCRIAGRVFYPVGRFRTVLAAPDIQAAADCGALEAVHDGWLFTMSRHLAKWARWVLEIVRDKSGTIGGCVRIWAKLAARAVIGKFAQRGWRTEPYVGPPCDGWSVDQITELYTGARGVVTGIDGEYFISWADQRGEHERPAVLAFVEAHVRQQIGAVTSGPYGLGIAQCDTDGVMISHSVMQSLAGHLPPRWVNGRAMPAGTPEIVAIWNEQAGPFRWREKNQFTRAAVYGPQHVVLDGRLRAAGIPKGAWQQAANTWIARLWPGMSWQSRHSSPGQYGRPVQPYTLKPVYAAGWALKTGAVRPAEARWDAEEGNVLVPWGDTRWAASGDVLGPQQAAWAAGLWAPPENDPHPDGMLL